MAIDRLVPFDRIPPQSLEMEQAVLGCMLIERAAIEKAAGIVRAEDFYRDAHRVIFEAILALVERDEPVDILTVQDQLRDQEVLEQVGGTPYLIQLTDAVPSAANVEYYAKVVEEKAILRRLIDAAAQVQAMAHSDYDDISDLVDRAERAIFGVSQRRINSYFTPMRPLVHSVYEQIEFRSENKEATTGLATPFEDLNYITAGLQPSDLIIIAARPSMGKTSLALGMAQYIAIKQRQPAAIFSLEMSKEQLCLRMICSEARVDAHRLRTGYLQNDDWRRVGEACAVLSDAPLFVDDSPDCSALEMRAKCRRLMAEQGLGVIVVDYLQLMRGHKRTENRVQEIGEIARALKGLARELKVPVVALSQLSRAVEQRPDKRPMLSDLRECVTGDTRLIRADTGALTPISEIRPGDSILAVGKDMKVVGATVSDVWRKGRKPVFRVTTETGRVIKCTDNHPFLIQSGYKPLRYLRESDLIATPLRLPAPDRALPERSDTCRFLGYAESDILWERIRSIEPAGEEETWDIRVPDTGNFIAEGIVVHNSGSIEAEADVVVFIYRDAYYKMKEALSAEAEEAEKEERQKRGEDKVEEAELIIAKQRNGPTGKVMVAFHPHYARFDNLAKGYGGREE